MLKKKSFVLLLLILFLASFLRLYRISDYMTFLGDEGRDVIVAREILSGDFTLLGPRASAGDFYLGPIYYYMIAPWLGLFNYDPVGPAIMVALFGIATVILVYLVGEKFFDQKTGLVAAALYSVSPIVITYSHSSWNPNVLPFFSLLIILLIYKAVNSSRSRNHYFLLTGFLLGIALQLHYIALFLGIIIFFFVLIADWLHHKKFEFLLLAKRYLQIFIGFLVGFSPFLLFEIRHGFPNIRTIFSFITKDTLSDNYEKGASFLSIVGDVFYRSFGNLVFNSLYVEKNFGDSIVFGVYSTFVIIVAIISLVVLYKAKNRLAMLLVYLWIILGIVLFGFYKKPIFDYYFTFFFPAPFLIIAHLLSQIYNCKKKKYIGLIISFLLFLGLFGFNLFDNKFRYEPNRQKDQIKNISNFIVEKAGNKPFNFALIAAGNSDHGYRYYFDILGNPAKSIENLEIDPERKSVEEQLFIVCEEAVCSPLGHPLFEIANFGRAEIAGEWDVSVVKIYKMVPFEE